MKTELDGHTIHIYCDDPAMAEKVAALPGCQWDEDNGRWVMLLMLDEVKALREMGFDLCPELRRYYVQETRKEPEAAIPVTEGISFTVPGPLYPHKRMTRNEISIVKLERFKVPEDLMPAWRKLQDYKAWKRKVADCAEPFKFARSPKKKLYMHVALYFEVRNHGNPENYWKAVADALFTSSKYVAGSFDYFYGDPARAEVVISKEPPHAPEVAEKEVEPF